MRVTGRFRMEGRNRTSEGYRSPKRYVEARIARMELGAVAALISTCDDAVAELRC